VPTTREGAVVLADLLGPLVLLAILTAFVPAVWRSAPRWLRWVGHLPGDLRIERPGYRLYLPLVSAVVVSLTLTLLVSVLGWLLGLAPLLLSWIGRLPGDVVIRRGGSSLYLPLASMLLLSLILSALGTAISWLLRRGRPGSRREGSAHARSGA
jgi:hypothetical protein